MSWARSFYLKERSSLYKHKRIMSSCFCSEWSLWSFLSKMSEMNIMLIMLTVITSDSSDQSNHFKTLITQWLFNYCYYIISCEKVLTVHCKLIRASVLFSLDTLVTTHWLKRQFFFWSSQNALTSSQQHKIKRRWCFRFTFHHLQRFSCWTQ